MQAGDAFGDFVVDEVRETRGATVITVARDPRWGRRVAIKVLDPEFRADRAIRERFVLEARALSLITSKHSLAVIDFGKTDDDVLYMVIEHVEAEGLAERLARRGPFAIPDAVSSVMQACEAVAEANEKGIVHGDLSAASLRLATDGAGRWRVLVVDFALTRAVVPAAWIEGHAAPEQRRGEEPDARTDVWGLGTTLYTFLAGDPTRAPALRSQRRDVPVGLEAVVAKCLEGERDARFASARELSRALSRYAVKPGRQGVRDREIRLAWLARARIRDLVASGLTMDAVKKQMKRSIVRPTRIPAGLLMRIAGRWNVPLWALEAVAHEPLADDEDTSREKPRLGSPVAPTTTGDDLAPKASQPETPSPDALRPAALPEVLGCAKQGDSSGGAT